MRTLSRAILVIAGLFVIALVAVYFNLARIVKSEVQQEGTKSLRLETTLNHALISLFGGKLDLHGLEIASPKSFSAPKMLEIGNVGVEVSYGQLRENPIHVGALKIERPKLVIEQSGGTLNFRKAMELVPASDSKKPPMKLIIDRIDVQDALVVIRPGLPGVQEQIEVPIPSLSMKDVGRGKGAQNGAAIKDVAMQVMTALAEKAAQSDKLPVELKGLLHLNAATIVSKLGTDALRNVADQVPVAKGLEGLIPQGRSPDRKR